MKRACFSLFLLLLAVFSNSSCGNKKSISSDVTNDSTDTAKVEMYVWVDNARLRDEPNTEAKIIVELKASDKVNLTGQESDTKSKVKLRGVEFEDVWVRAIAEDGTEGWVFKPTLTNSKEKADAMNDFIIVPSQRIGQVKLGANQEGVENIFGEVFVTKGEIFFPEGLSSPGFYVFKNSPYELQCSVNDQGEVYSIHVRQPASPWQTEEGIKIGTKLEELLTLNGKPIKFSGFGWDYGGVVLGYSGGKLAKYENLLSVILSEPENLDGLDDILGDGTFTTAQYNLKKRGVRVAELGIVDMSDYPVAEN